MFSTLTERGAAVTLEALTLGADDYLAKPSNETSLDQSRGRLKDEMIPKIKQFFQSPDQQQTPFPTMSLSHPVRPKTSPAVVVIGISTGGPAALNDILPKLPGDFPLPILIVQHMPPLFTRFLAERLNANCALRVEEAAQDRLVEAGCILIAPGDFHMRLVSNQGRVCVHLDQSAQQNFCRPAADALFRSASEVYGGAVMAVVLTGMGEDGLRGVEILRASGATIVAQDEKSSVVWGMPGAVVNAGFADVVLPLNEVVPHLLRVSEMS